MKTIFLFIVTLAMQYWDEVKMLTMLDVVETFIFNLLLFRAMYVDLVARDLVFQ